MQGVFRHVCPSSLRVKSRALTKRGRTGSERGRRYVKYEQQYALRRVPPGGSSPRPHDNVSDPQVTWESSWIRMPGSD
jgi:hypothetical protein